jgi:hypothetical protein
MIEQRPDIGPPPAWQIDDDLFGFIGEVVSLPESLGVAPSQGRFRREPLVEGTLVHAGSVIGTVAFNGSKVRPVTLSKDGVFLGWLAWDGEALTKGVPLARFAPSNGNGNGAR